MISLVNFIRERLHYSFGMQFPNILEMAQVNHDTNGVFNKNKMKIQVYGGTTEHNPPHVHIMDKSRTFDIRVTIDEEAELLSVKKHNKKINYNEIVGSFRMWLLKYSEVPGMSDKTNLELCITAWNLNNPDKMIDIN